MQRGGRTRSSAASCASVSSGQQQTSWLSCMCRTAVHRVAACSTQLTAIPCGVTLCMHALWYKAALHANLTQPDGSLLCTGAAGRIHQGKQLSFRCFSGHLHQAAPVQHVH